MNPSKKWSRASSRVRQRSESCSRLGSLVMSVKTTPILAKTIEAEEAAEKYHEFQEQAEKGNLANLRDVINAQEDLHLRSLNVHSEGWRYDLSVRKSYIKNEEEWLANVQQRQKEKEPRREKKGKRKISRMIKQASTCVRRQR